MKKRLRQFWVEWAKPLSIYLFLMCAVRSAVADWNDVPSGSMKPTILEGDRVVINKLAYDFQDNSFDSRFYGPVAREQIVGRAVGVAFSLDRDGFYLPRRDRFVRKLE